MLYLRYLFIILASIFIVWSGFFLAEQVPFFNDSVSRGLRVFSFLIALLFMIIGWWWIKSLWQKSIAVLTNKRLIKFVYTTPVSRYSLTLPLEMIVDTGAYTKGFIQTFLQLGTFIARSSAASSGVATEDTSRINKKYFYINNVSKAEDLQQYISKLLSTLRRTPEKVDYFRPFIPHLKGEARKQFLAENFPEYL